MMQKGAALGINGGISDRSPLNYPLHYELLAPALLSFSTNPNLVWYHRIVHHQEWIFGMSMLCLRLLKVV